MTIIKDVPRPPKAETPNNWPQCSSLPRKTLHFQVAYLRTSSSKRHPLHTGGFAALGMLERPFECCRAFSGLQNRRRVMSECHPRADTCVAEACKTPDTLGGCDLFSFQLLNQPDRSSLGVRRVGSANKFPLHWEISVSVPACS